MTGSVWAMVALALLTAVLAGLLATVETALLAVSPARAGRLVAEGTRGAAAVREIAEDPAPEITITAFLRTLFEVTAIVLGCLAVVESFSGLGIRLSLSISVLVLLSFVL